MTRTELAGLALVLLTAAAVPARAGDREFHDVVVRLSSAYHKKPMPFMGLVSFAARFAQPEGVSGFKLAVFDGIDPTLSPDGRQFSDFMQDVLGSEYHPFVRVRSKNGEQTYIYLRDRKDDSELLLVTLDPSDAVVMKVRLKPEMMKEWADEPVREAHNSVHHFAQGGSVD